jgi:hypothetical protein
MQKMEIGLVMYRQKDGPDEMLDLAGNFLIDEET